MSKCNANLLAEADALDEPVLPAKITPTRIAETVIRPPEPAVVPESAVPDTPPAILPPASSLKKGGRPPNTHKKKLGKNQYTKDRDMPEKEKSPNRSQSRDVQKDDTPAQSTKANIAEGRHTKAKHFSTKHTMFDMKRRVNAILEFITRTQLEMAGDTMSATNQQATLLVIGDLAGGLPMIRVNGETSTTSTTTTSEAASPTKEFQDLSLLEQMDNLTRQLVKWQKEFV